MSAISIRKSLCHGDRPDASTAVLPSLPRVLFLSPCNLCLQIAAARLCQYESAKATRGFYFLHTACIGSVFLLLFVFFAKNLITLFIHIFVAVSGIHTHSASSRVSCCAALYVAAALFVLTSGG